jgi:acyl-CoA reductase-like NAD-dependent aldehyde dehydrogenase
MTTVQPVRPEDAITEAAHLINGELVRGTETFTVINPATEEVVGECPAATPDLVEAAMQAAKAALPEWGRDEERRRAAIIEMADRLAQHAGLLAHVLALESGKTFAGFEVKGAEMHARFWANFPIPVDTIHDDATQRVTLERFPVGVVAAITPWNGPLVMLLNKLACALLVGNTVVAKPSPFTPLSTLVLGSLLRDVFPPGVVNLIAGDDEVGKAIVAHPLTNLISFTGSVEAGKAIARSAADDLKRVCLELGGNDAAIVLPDANLETAVPKLYRGAFAMSGQICVAIKRLYVHSSVYDQVVEEMTRIAESQKLGGPFEDGTTMGPLTTRPQFERVSGLVDDARAAGAQVFTGGERIDRPGFFYRPTLIGNVAPGVRIVDEEQFGPALPLIRYDDVDDAIDAANSTSYGLGGSIWTSDVDRGVDLARRLESGSAWVNRHPAVGPDLPFGGFKHSGLGRENGAPGIDHFSELKTVSVDLSELPTA